MEEKKGPPRGIVPRDTPNDGFPENWHPVDEPPVTVGVPGLPSGPMPYPIGTGPFFAGTIPLTFQLTPDIMPTRYPGGLGGYRVFPPGPAGLPANIAAAQSATAKK